MAGNLNQVQIIGRVGRDAETRSIGHDGTRIATLNVATSETWRDRSTGERKEKTEWHRITVWQENAVDFCDRYVRKGDLIFVQGKLETRKWQDQQGNDRYATEIHVRFGGQVTALASPGGGNGNARSDQGGGYDDGYGSTGGRLRDMPQETRQHGSGRMADDLDDEIPF